LYSEKSFVQSIDKISDEIFLIKVFSPAIATIIKPGQFCNIKVSESSLPLLRRPFSVSDVEDDCICFLFEVHGNGTDILSKKKNGDVLEILGPLGNGFSYKDDFQTAIIVAGGLGVAPFPLLVKNIESDKEIISLVGGRTIKHIVTQGLINISVATDDGSMGYKGTVLELLQEKIINTDMKKSKIFSCGPNPMLKALQKLCGENNYECEISIESAMACGFGICQGCPIEPSNGDSYLLVCKDGPVFNSKAVKL